MEEQYVLESDPSALDADPGELGWIGVDRDAPDVVALRERLIASNGIKGLQAVRPDQVDLAVQLFRRDGFVVVLDALTSNQLDFLKAGCDREIRNILAKDRNRIGNRGSHRYSFGSASLSRHLIHHPEWAMLIDLPTTTPIVSAIFGADDYHLKGGGGDFCLPGSVRYQRLHADMGDRQQHTTTDGTVVQTGSFQDPAGQHSIRDLPIPNVTCNFLTVDFTALNGPTRQIPGTQNSRAAMPPRDDEPDWMQLSTVCPAPAGSVLIRDVRAWHGGTPNLSDEARAIPNVEFWAPWYREPKRPAMPLDVWQGLSEHAQRVSRDHVALDGETDYGVRDDLGRGYA